MSFVKILLPLLPILTPVILSSFWGRCTQLSVNNTSGKIYIPETVELKSFWFQPLLIH